MARAAPRRPVMALESSARAGAISGSAARTGPVFGTACRRTGSVLGRSGTGGRGRSSADSERRIAGEFRHAEQVLGIQPPRRALVRLERRGSPYLVRRRTDGARGRTDGSGGRSPTGLSPGARGRLGDGGGA